MSRLLICLAFMACAFAADNVSSSDLCVEYAECLEKVIAKTNECRASDADEKKKNPCEETVKINEEILQLQDEKAKQRISCIKEKASGAELLTGKKANRCSVAARKVSRRNAEPALKRDKRKDRKDKKDNKKATCAKESKKLRANCAKIARCCSVVKDCNAAPSDDLKTKKQQLKDAAASCKAAKKANRKGGKKDE